MENISIQLLISTMHQNDYSLLEKMNIFCDAIVVNQCDADTICNFTYKGFRIIWINSTERGVGNSRNLALSKATAQYCMLADDDMVYYDVTYNSIAAAITDLPQAEAIAFNVDYPHKSKPKHTSIKRLRTTTAMRYGAYQLLFKMSAIKRLDMYFSNQFGGGAMFSSGEDSIFIRQFLTRGGIMYAHPTKLVGLNNCGQSTWFNGFDEKFFIDKGALFAALFPHWSSLAICYYYVKHYKTCATMRNSLALLFRGKKKYLNLLKNERTDCRTN